MLDVCAGAGELTAIYAGDMLEWGGATVGGPAVDTEGMEEIGEED